MTRVCPIRRRLTVVWWRRHATRLAEWALGDRRRRFEARRERRRRVMRQSCASYELRDGMVGGRAEVILLRERRPTLPPLPGVPVFRSTVEDCHECPCLSAVITSVRPR